MTVQCGIVFTLHLPLKHVQKPHSSLFCPDEVPEKGRKTSAFFVYVSMVLLILIRLIKYCSGYSFGSLNRGRKAPPI